MAIMLMSVTLYRAGLNLTIIVQRHAIEYHSEPYMHVKTLRQTANTEDCTPN